jgi:hypothetical protein
MKILGIDVGGQDRARIRRLNLLADRFRPRPQSLPTRSNGGCRGADRGKFRLARSGWL